MTLSLIVAVVAGLAFLMVVAWLVQLATANAGWVDAIWSLGTGLAGVAFALGRNEPDDGWNGRHLCLALLVGLWSLRLAIHIAIRVASGPEDARYRDFRERWGVRFQARLFWFFQLQGACALLLTLAILLAARNPAPWPGPLDIAAIVLLLGAIVGEAVADRQLRQWKRQGKGSICTVGLWRLSRHPNYFFEFLGWCAYPLMAIDPSGSYLWGWAALLAPVFIYWLLVHVSGIPPLERHMLARHGCAYRDYQRRTNPFFPALLRR